MDASGMVCLWLPPFWLCWMYHAVVQERLYATVKYPASVDALARTYGSASGIWYRPSFSRILSGSGALVRYSRVPCLSFLDALARHCVSASGMIPTIRVGLSLTASLFERIRRTFGSSSANRVRSEKLVDPASSICLFQRLSHAGPSSNRKSETANSSVQQA